MRLLLLLAALVVALPAAAQPLVLRGTVTGTDGTPLIGAHVIERGTTNGTTTDAEGRYTLHYGRPEAVVVFNYVGYQRQEIAVDGRVTLDVALTEGVDLSELMVVGSRSYDRSVTETTVPVLPRPREPKMLMSADWWRRLPLTSTSV